MNLNLILIIIAGFSSAWILFQTIFTPRSYNRGWMVVSAVVLAIIIALFFIEPEAAGYGGAAVWGLLILVPSLGSRLAYRLLLQQKYRQARQLASLLRWLHPADGWLEQPELLEALVLGQQGAFAEAAEILKRFETTESPLSRLATTQLYRMNGQWEELLGWLQNRLDQKEFQNDPNILALYLRTLGETGDLNGLVRSFDQFKKELEKTRSLLMGYLFLFAFGGRKKEVARMFEGPLKFYPSSIQSFWLATAEFAGGNEAAGHRLLTEALENEDVLIRTAAERRRAQPPPLAGSILTPEARQIVAQAERELDQEARFSGWALWGGSRAYLTYGLIGLNLIIFIVEILTGGSRNPYTLYRLGALVPAAVEAGQWWRLFSSLFLHHGFIHLSLNMLALYILGPFVESVLGWRRYIFLYLVAGVGAGLVVVALAVLGLLPTNQLLVGASGGIMGLIGATGAIMLRGWRQEKARVASKRLIAVGLIVALQVILDLLVPQTSFTAHLAGAIIGFLVAGLLPHQVSGQGENPQENYGQS